MHLVLNVRVHVLRNGLRRLKKRIMSMIFVVLKFRYAVR